MEFTYKWDHLSLPFLNVATYRPKSSRAISDLDEIIVKIFLVIVTNISFFRSRFGRSYMWSCERLAMGSIELTAYTCARCFRDEMNFFWLDHEAACPLVGYESDDDDVPGNGVLGFHCLRCRDELAFRDICEFLQRKLDPFSALYILSFVRRQPYRDLRARRLYRICMGKPYSTNVLWELKQQVEDQVRGFRGRKRKHCVFVKENIDAIEYIVSFLTWETGLSRQGEWENNALRDGLRGVSGCCA